MKQREGFALVIHGAPLSRRLVANAPRAVQDEEQEFPPSFLSEGDWRHIVRSLKLSPQQSRIVGLILQGKQDKEIAAELKLNRYTIKTYMRRIFDRVGVQDRVDLILLMFAICIRSRDVMRERKAFDDDFQPV